MAVSAFMVRKCVRGGGAIRRGRRGKGEHPREVKTQERIGSIRSG
jgi:hypothetical protein